MCHPVKVTAVNDASAYLCCVSIHIFCCGMYNYICTKFKWSAVNRCRKSIVYNKRYPIFMCNPCKKLNIKNFKCRIRNRLTKDKFCIRSYSCL